VAWMADVMAGLRWWVRGSARGGGGMIEEDFG